MPHKLTVLINHDINHGLAHDVNFILFALALVGIRCVPVSQCCRKGSVYFYKNNMKCYIGFFWEDFILWKNIVKYFITPEYSEKCQSDSRSRTYIFYFEVDAWSYHDVLRLYMHESTFHISWCILDFYFRYTQPMMHLHIHKQNISYTDTQVNQVIFSETVNISKSLGWYWQSYCTFVSDTAKFFCSTLVLFNWRLFH